MTAALSDEEISRAINAGTQYAADLRGRDFVLPDDGVIYEKTDEGIANVLDALIAALREARESEARMREAARFNVWPTLHSALLRDAGKIAEAHGAQKYEELSAIINGVSAKIAGEIETALQPAGVPHA